MKKCFNKTLRVLLVLGMLFAGNNILGLDLGSLIMDSDVAYASNMINTNVFRVNLGNTTVRSDGTSSAAGAAASNVSIGEHFVTNLPSGATFTRTNHAPRRMNGWTWIRGTLSGDASVRTGTLPSRRTVGTSTAVWISTSQLTRPNTTRANFEAGRVRGTMCEVSRPDTVLRYDPSRGIDGNRAVLRQRGAVFMTGDAGPTMRVNSNGFTFTQGTLHGNATQTTGEVRNGATRTNFNHGVVSIATSQLSLVSLNPHTSIVTNNNNACNN